VAALSDIEIVGVKPEEVKISDYQLPPKGDELSNMPPGVYRALRNQFVRSPEFDREKCTGCRTCVDACPVKCIGGEGKELSVNYSTCIRCYCCQEVCPEEAIYLKTKPLRKALDSLFTLAYKIRSMKK
jgi:ferredoxin